VVKTRLLGVLAVAACRLPSFDFDDTDTLGTLDTLGDASLSSVTDATADTTDADATADTTGDPPPPACGFEGFGGAALSWSRTVLVDDLELSAARDIAIDPLGDVLALFEGSTEGESIDLVLAKYSMDGTFLWSVVWDGDEGLDDEAWGLAIDAWGDAYVAGSETTSEIESDGGTTIDMRSIVLKVTSAGVPAWRFEREAPPPPPLGANGRAAAIDAVGGAIAVALGPTSNGSATTEVLVLDRFGNLSSSFVRTELGDPLGIEITTSGDLVLAGAAWPGGSQWLAYLAVDGTEVWRRLDPSDQVWRAIALGPADDVLVLADGGDSASTTTVHRYAKTGVPIASQLVATWDVLGSGTDVAGDCAGGAAVAAAQWIDGDEHGVLGHVDGAGTPWSAPTDGGDRTSPPARVAVDPTGGIALVGPAWLARYVVL
jgi:hypothetical protein